LNFGHDIQLTTTQMQEPAKLTILIVNNMFNRTVTLPCNNWQRKKLNEVKVSTLNFGVSIT